MNLHIYGPAAHARCVQHCRTCRRRRRCVAYVYYDWTHIACCGCAEDPRCPAARFNRISRRRADRIWRVAEDWRTATTWRKAMEATL